MGVHHLTCGLEIRRCYTFDIQAQEHPDYINSFRSLSILAQRMEQDILKLFVLLRRDLSHRILQIVCFQHEHLFRLLRPDHEHRLSRSKSKKSGCGDTMMPMRFSHMKTSSAPSVCCTTQINLRALGSTGRDPPRACGINAA